MMQAHHYPPSLPYELPLNIVQPAFDGPSGSSASYLAPIDGLDPEGFSRGSSCIYPNTEHDYFTDRGASLSSIPEYLSTISVDECATGLVISGNARSGGGITGTGNEMFATEDVPGYHQVQQQEWQWERLTGPVHGVRPPSSACARAADIFATVKSTFSQSPVASSSSGILTLSSPTPISTPASMAITLPPHVRATGRIQHQQARRQAASPHINERSESGDPDIDALQHPQAVGQPHLNQQEPAAEVIDGPLRERKHGCTMCHKRFDRPSTLRKHLLVHTGEKAFVCETCGRRFGVASNLNRHVKKCVLRPVNAPKSGSSPVPENAQTSSGSLAENMTSSSTQPQNESSSSASSSVPSSRGRQPHPARDPSAPKRRRRAPSPSRWVPPSLLNFVLQCPEAKKACPVPLPPVRRSLPMEERDSYDEDVDPAPYHPRGWKDVLPGPGLGMPMGFGGRAARHLNLGGNGGFMGRVMVF